MRGWQQRSPLMSKWNTDYTPTLWILENNVLAKRLYDRPGEIPNLYRSGVTEYMMAKDLKSD